MFRSGVFLAMMFITVAKPCVVHVREFPAGTEFHQPMLAIPTYWEVFYQL